MFTTNLATAAPVQVSRRHLADGRAAAVVLNSGNANAATGERRACATRCGCASSPPPGSACLPRDVLVCSTGLIGIPMPMDPVEAGIPKLTGMLSADADGGTAAADAILTTDTVRKETLQRADIGGRRSPRPSAAWPRAPRCCRPRWPRCSRCITTDAAVDSASLHAMLEQRGQSTRSTR